MNKEEFGKWDLSEARRFLECFCKVECSEGTSDSGKSTELKEFDGKIPLDDTSSWSNKTIWKELAERLATQCTRFCK